MKSRKRWLVVAGIVVLTLAVVMIGTLTYRQMRGAQTAYQDMARSGQSAVDQGAALARQTGTY